MTNWQLISTLATLVFAIFGGSWLNLRQKEKLIGQLGRRFDAKFDGLRAEMKAENNALSQKVDRIDRQLEALFKPTLPRG